ncbi:AAA family ATPase [Desulfobacula sp.]|uniref:SF1B family DNA helicase RecD2 n=1 Tax=Desulfobacula sp. TaxID=2593537 RepID=UPI0026088693|nr:AAA family ATPase [Desulfobacula sp.]
MKQPAVNQTGVITEVLKGIVDRVTFHNPDNGWSILRVLPFNNPHGQETVIVHQTQVFAGATMEFEGSWTVHPKYGRQFQASLAREKKPATIAALEKYLGSGLIKGVGPKTAKKIVRYFDHQTLAVFEESIERLIEIPGIAQKKLDMISRAWTEHKAIREVMMFLQSHGISTLFAVRIYKVYKEDAIKIVTKDPYRLANDFYGIGFFSADKVALSIGLEPDSRQRIMAGIRHVLAASRNFGHCYLTAAQIDEQVKTVLQLDLSHKLVELLQYMEREKLLMRRELVGEKGTTEHCYYSKSLYFDEGYVAKRIVNMGPPPRVDMVRVDQWMAMYCKANTLSLSTEQADAAKGIVCEKFSILTGGPGCGKTTITRVIVKLIQAMGLTVLLAAPTGRAAQRMTDVIGQESKTIHRVLGWQNGKFKKNEEAPLKTDFLVVDECSMLDINLTASLLKAVPETAQVLFIGDPDQLPSVGAGNVLKDIIASGRVPCFKLTQIFRQAQASLIIKYAHQINKGDMPWIQSPFKSPDIWQDKIDCLFLDSDEATQEQIQFIARVKRFYALTSSELENTVFEASDDGDFFEFRIQEPVIPYETEISIPKKFEHVNLKKVSEAQTRIEELLLVVKKVHPWSTLHYGLAAFDVIRKLYQEWIPKYYGQCEIQILSPMTRGSLGTVSLNKLIQETANPYAQGKRQLKVGERIFRVGDRVIHRRNNYDLGVFNGDIGVIRDIDTMALTCTVVFYPDNRRVHYKQTDIMELDLAYAITIHKSQGSEFEIVIIPVLTQHYKMLFRNLIYTGITRAKKLVVFVGTRKALSMAVKNHDISKRQTALQVLLMS